MIDPGDDVLLRLAERYAPTPSPYRGKPVEWTVDKLREWNTEDQKRIMRSVVDHRYTAVQSSNDIGKSRTAARIVGWWLDSYPIGQAFAVTTAPTAAQISAILWREIGQMHRKGKLVGRVVTGKDQWKHGWAQNDDELIGFGRKPSDYNSVAITGIHARYVLVVIDEACGVSQPIYDALDTIVTNRNARVLAIGNPDDPSSHFAKICKPGSGWNVIHIDGLRQPTFTRERVAEFPELQAYMIKHGIPPSEEPLPEELHDMLITPEWVWERMRRWGITSPMWASKVRGEFPRVAVDALIHPHFVIPYGPVTEAAGLTQQLGHSLGVQLPLACIDDTGVGGGVTDILMEDGYPTMPIIASAASNQFLPNGKPRFKNYRSELMWNMREAFAGPSGTGDDGWLDIDPEDEDLAAQLTNIKYKINRHGQIEVESKDDMAARGLPSPDRADALSYSLAPNVPRMTATVKQEKMITSDLLGMRW
jgi:hypothetical protein